MALSRNPGSRFWMRSGLIQASIICMLLKNWWSTRERWKGALFSRPGLMYAMPSSCLMLKHRFWNSTLSVVAYLHRSAPITRSALSFPGRHVVPYFRRNSASFLQRGERIDIPSSELMTTANPYYIVNGYSLVAYPNRNYVPSRVLRYSGSTYCCACVAEIQRKPGLRTGACYSWLV